MYKRLSFAEYQEIDALSQSAIKMILANPFHWANNSGTPKKSDALDFGSYCHDLILSPDEIPSKYKVSKFDKLDFRNKECKAEKEEAEEKGLILLDGITRAKAEALYQNNKADLDIWFDGGAKELSIIETLNIDEIGEVKCKGKLDWINDYRNRIIDLKIMQKADKESFTKSVVNYGYHIQASFYLELTGAKTFHFIVIEKEPPFMMGIYTLDEMALELGKKEWMKALNIYKNKKEFQTNVYFDYKDQDANIIQTITLPTWAYYRDGEIS